jgi:hypothetical protein
MNNANIIKKLLIEKKNLNYIEALHILVKLYPTLQTVIVGFGFRFEYPNPKTISIH